MSIMVSVGKNNQRPRAENARLRQDVESLKRATAFFASIS
ncbi:hypothetical protein SAMN05661093_01982 [Kibdelosporangium aridum]|uniref:Uncharacterized protein n=1 Tax=Kibdelosporangium aridum TaxID=2030 RepID=A0A1W2CFH9_KIBAR|nr:hypothetical protein SAMN05661093_01982 [Kibdelosporangium aridum]